MKSFCEARKRFREKMLVYRQLGYLLQVLRRNQKALKCYKNMMYLSWFYDDFKMENESYQGIALNYFYLGSLKKAKYYHERAIRGKSENDDSLVKKTAI